MGKDRGRFGLVVVCLVIAAGFTVYADMIPKLNVPLKHCPGASGVLFQSRLVTAVQGFPVTYSIGGTQYLVISGGNRGNLGGSAL